jgi:hypothetical protein
MNNSATSIIVLALDKKKPAYEGGLHDLNRLQRSVNANWHVQNLRINLFSSKRSDKLDYTTHNNNVRQLEKASHCLRVMEQMEALVSYLKRDEHPNQAKRGQNNIYRGSLYPSELPTISSD